MEKKKRRKEKQEEVKQEETIAYALDEARAADWPVGEVVAWVKQLHGGQFAKFAPAFVENDIDGSLLLELTKEMLASDMGISSLGARKKFVAAIQLLKEAIKQREEEE